MAGYCWKGLEIAGSCLIWLKVALTKQIDMAENVLKWLDWLEIAGNTLAWLEKA